MRRIKYIIALVAILVAARDGAAWMFINKHNVDQNKIVLPGNVVATRQITATLDGSYSKQIWQFHRQEYFAEGNSARHQAQPRMADVNDCRIRALCRLLTIQPSANLLHRTRFALQLNHRLTAFQPLRLDKERPHRLVCLKQIDLPTTASTDFFPVEAGANG